MSAPQPLSTVNDEPADLVDFPFLDAYLEPISAVLVQPDVTDIYVHRPGEI